MLDILSYLLGTQDGKKTVVMDGDNVEVVYDAETKTVTLTKGGDEE